MVRRLEAILSLLAVALLSASVEASVWAQLSAQKQAAGETTRAKAARRTCWPNRATTRRRDLRYIPRAWS